jgi:hypothetical protein
MVLVLKVLVLKVLVLKVLVLKVLVLVLATNGSDFPVISFDFVFSQASSVNTSDGSECSGVDGLATRIGLAHIIVKAATTGAWSLVLIEGTESNESHCNRDRSPGIDRQSTRSQ